jgi:predicted HTH domain antitoxin
MQQTAISLPDDLLTSLNMTIDEVAASMRKEYAVRMYQAGKLTLLQSAELCAMNIYDFLSALSLAAVPVIDYDANELEKELAEFKVLCV